MKISKQREKETIKFRTPSPWRQLPEEHIVNSVNFFTWKIKNWKCKTCPCRLCETFQKGLGFIWLCLFISLFIYLFVFLFLFLVFYCFLYRCSNFSSTSHTMEKMNEQNFQFGCLKGRCEQIYNKPWKRLASTN